MDSVLNADFLQVDLEENTSSSDLEKFQSRYRRDHPHVLKVNFSARSILRDELISWSQALAPDLDHFLCSNAFFLSDESIERILQTRLTRLGFYLESLDPNLQEKLRPGEYLEKILACFDRIKSKRPEISTAIYTHILKENQEELIRIVDYSINSPLIDSCLLQLHALETPVDLKDFKDAQQSFPGNPASSLEMGTISEIISRCSSSTTLKNPIEQLDFFRNHLAKSTSDSLESSNMKDVSCCGDKIFSRIHDGEILHHCSLQNPENLEPSSSSEFSKIRNKIRSCTRDCHFKLNHHMNRSGLETIYEDRQFSSLHAQENWNPPKSLCITLSETCNLKCKMCYNWKKRVPMAPGYYLAVRNFLFEFSRLVELPFPLVLAGAEPLLDPELMGLIELGSRLGFETQMVTNGILLNRQSISELRQAGLKVLTLPLEGVSEETHNQLRPKHFHLVFERIALLQELFPEIEVTINAVISDLNFTEMVPLAHLVHEHPFLTGVYFNIVVQPFASDSVNSEWYETQEEKDLWPGPGEELLSVLKELKELKLKGFQIKNPASQFDLFSSYLQDPKTFVHDVCPVEDQGMILKSNGDLCHCPFFPLSSLGNILNQPLDDILYGIKAEYHRQVMGECRTNCHLCVNCFSGCA